MDGNERTEGRSSAGGQSPSAGQPSAATQDPSAAPHQSPAPGEDDYLRTYTPEQVAQVVKDRHSKLDKTIAQLTRERDILKTSHDALSTQFADLQRRIDEADEAKYKDDPDGLDIYQRRKKLLSEQAAVKAEREALAKEKQDNAARLQKAAAAEWEAVVAEVASAVKGDANKLEAKAAEYGVTDGEKLRGLAGDLWPSGVKADSGQTSGGGTDINKLSPREQIARGLKGK
jgi:hypothetical protein